MSHSIPTGGRNCPISKAVLDKSPELRKALGVPDCVLDTGTEVFMPPAKPAKRVRQSRELNKTETRYLRVIEAQGIFPIWKQQITLALDPPFTSYRADLAYIGGNGQLIFVECKAAHRFRERGIAKVALAAKTFPQFTFVLADWQNGHFVISVLTP